LEEASYDHEVEEVHSAQDAAFVVGEACFHSDTYVEAEDLVFQMEEVEFYFVVAAVVVDTVVVIAAHSMVVGMAAVAEERSFVVLDHSPVVEDLDCTEAVLDLHMDFRHLHKDCHHTDHNLVLHLDRNLAAHSLVDSCCSMVVVEDSLLVRIHCNIDCFAVDVGCMPSPTRYRIKTSDRA